MFNLDDLAPYINVEAARRDKKIILVGIRKDDTIDSVTALCPDAYPSRAAYLDDFTIQKRALIRDPNLVCIQVIDAGRAPRVQVDPKEQKR